MLSTCDGCHDTVCAFKLFTVLFPSALPKESHVTVRLFEQQREEDRAGVIYITATLSSYIYMWVFVYGFIYLLTIVTAFPNTACQIEGRVSTGAPIT